MRILKLLNNILLFPQHIPVRHSTPWKTGPVAGGEPIRGGCGGVVPWSKRGAGHRESQMAFIALNTMISPDGCVDDDFENSLDIIQISEL